MRVAVEVLGIAVPLLLVFGEPLLFDGQPFLRGSLGAYYYSGVRELFVGALCAIGVFLLTYKVAERSRENRLSTSPASPSSPSRCSRPGGRGRA